MNSINLFESKQTRSAWDDAAQRKKLNKKED